MDAGIQKMIKALESELGYTESASGHSKFGDWYEQNVDDSYDFSNAAWCDMFLAWGASQAGVTTKTGQFAYTPSHAAWFKKQDAWGTKPAPGALVFYDWSGGDSIGGIDHVGIVTEVEGDQIHTIEGNVDGINAKRKVREQDSVVGYGYPDQVATEPAPPPASPAPPATPAQPAAPANPAAIGAGAEGTYTSALTQAATMPEAVQPVEFTGAFAAVMLPAIAVAVLLKSKLPSLRRGRHRAPRTATA